MAIARTTEPITDSDEVLERSLGDAHLPALLPALALASGDLSLLREDLRPTMQSPPLPQGGLSREAQAEAKAVALAALRRIRDGEVRQAPTMEGLRRAIEWMTGSSAQAASEYLPLVMEELAISEEDPRAPKWRKPSAVDFTVAIVGAGMSGILAGIRLRQAGVPFVILEKNADVGGTWFENTYPGARVDVSNAFYSYSFAQRVDWPTHYSTQDVLLDYFRDCAQEFGVREHVRFQTALDRAEWDEERARWVLYLDTPEGRETLEVQALVSAVGQLNRPKMPEIEGLDTFGGASFHSARWRHDVDLAGQRVAVIGTGASAAQFVPAIAPEVASLTVFQRTANWLANVPHYHDEVPAGQQWLFRHAPYYAHWYRFWLFWATVEGLLPAVRVDETWGQGERSVSERNDQLRALMTMYLQHQFEGQPDLLEQVIPDYPPGAKRILLDNGAWAGALKREHVSLVTAPIARVTEAGVETEDGRLHEADVLIYGTGFHASRFLTPMHVVGREGADLHVEWDGDARAYLGITVPKFPNFFMLYGPNTNIVVNGSIIYFSECEVHYILECVRALIEGDHASMECRQDVHDDYNEVIDAGNREMAWGASSVNSWYKNETGRVAQNWPFSLLDYWKQTRAPRPEDYLWR
ncbi:MAG: NAD(P)/FAD-dependent oxidoreductase [Dehalococcoidia bacterium]|nr:NAD(P)/FAD-dependent oxidoreductase [Dehalococcoidia bacterium]